MGAIPIPWCIMVSPEFITECGHITLRQFLLDPQAKLNALAATRRMFREDFGIQPVDEGTSVSPPSYTAAHVIGGADLLIPEDDFSMIRGVALQSPEDVKKLTMPSSYLEHPGMAPYVRMYRELVDRVGGEMEVGLSPGTQGVITTAKLLRGQDFFLDVIEHPDEAHRLVDFITEANIRFWREVRQLTGKPLEGDEIAIHDDFAGLMGPKLFGEYAVPCYKRFYEAFKPGLRLFHSELLRTGHLEYLPDLKADYLNLGEDQYLTPRDVLGVTDVPFEWHVKTATVNQGTPKMIEEEYMQALNDGAPAIITELCARRTPMRNIHAFVDIAQKHGPAVEPGGCYLAARKADEIRRTAG